MIYFCVRYRKYQIVKTEKNKYVTNVIFVMFFLFSLNIAVRIWEFMEQDSKALSKRNLFGLIMFHVI